MMCLIEITYYATLFYATFSDVLKDKPSKTN
jgi:hypothetical protein